MLMPVLDGFLIKPITVLWTSTLHQIDFKGGDYFRKKAYTAGVGRDQLEYLARPMAKCHLITYTKTSLSAKTQRVQDMSETIEKRLDSGLQSEIRDLSTKALIPSL